MAIQQVFAAAAQMVPYEPGIMDELDPVKALAVYIEGLGAPESIRRDAEDVKQLRAAKAKARSEEHTSELQSLMRISYAVFCLKKYSKSTTSRMTNRYNTQR